MFLDFSVRNSKGKYELFWSKAFFGRNVLGKTKWVRDTFFLTES